MDPSKYAAVTGFPEVSVVESDVHSCVAKHGGDGNCSFPLFSGGHSRTIDDTSPLRSASCARTCCKNSGPCAESDVSLSLENRWLWLLAN